MSYNVYDLAQVDTSLQRVSFKEYAGSCPRCLSTDSFHVQPGRKDNGAWMCRRCWPAEEKGWGDDIEYLRQMRGMSFQEAKQYLGRETAFLLERVDQFQSYVESTVPGRIEPPNQKWQSRTVRYIEQAITWLWSSKGKPGLDYLYARGLKNATIKVAQLGYVEEEEDGVIVPRIVIPWHAENNLYWCVNRRDIRPDIPHHRRYKNTFASSKSGLYGCGLLSRKFPTFLVEGELDALALAQECSDIFINVVATGGLDCSNNPKWVGRLARIPAVLVAYDREPRGEEKSKKWLDILEHNALRYRPLPPCKDVNDMLVQGYSIRTWVQGALDLFNEQNQDKELFTVPIEQLQPVCDADGHEMTLQERIALFQSRPCASCGSTDYVIREDGRLVCPCYVAKVEANRQLQKMEVHA